jgi:hypothetical protein
MTYFQPKTKLSLPPFHLYLASFLFHINCPRHYTYLEHYRLYQSPAAALNTDEQYEQQFHCIELKLHFYAFQGSSIQIDLIQQEQILYQRADFLLVNTENTREYICFFDEGVGAFDACLQVLLQQQLLAFNGFLIHAASAVFPQKQLHKAVVLAGVSGAGKSTSVRYGAFTHVLTDEMSIVMAGKNGKYYCFSTPFWSEDRCFDLNHYFVPLAVIAFPIKALYTKLVPKSIAQAYLELMQFVTCYQEDRSIEILLFDALLPLLAQIPAYDLYFPKPAQLIGLFSTQAFDEV